MGSGLTTSESMAEPATESGQVRNSVAQVHRGVKPSSRFIRHRMPISLQVVNQTKDEKQDGDDAFNANRLVGTC